MSESSLEFLPLNQPVYGIFVVYDYLHAPVTGLTQADFDILLSTEGAVSNDTVTITEVSGGRYLYTFTPQTAGEWYIIISHPVYNPRGWDDEFIVSTDDGIPDGGGSSWPYAKDYLRRTREAYERRDRIERLEADDEEAIMIILSSLE